MEGNFGSGKCWQIWQMSMNSPNLSQPNFVLYGIYFEFHKFAKFSSANVFIQWIRQIFPPPKFPSIWYLGLISTSLFTFGCYKVASLKMYCFDSFVKESSASPGLELMIAIYMPQVTLYSFICTQVTIVLFGFNKHFFLTLIHTAR